MDTGTLKNDNGHMNMTSIKHRNQMETYLSQASWQFIQDCFFVKHFPAKSMFIIIIDFNSQLPRKFSERHIFLNLFSLFKKIGEDGYPENDSMKIEKKKWTG